MEETLPYFEKEQMQPAIDFMAKYMDLLPTSNQLETIKKIVDNFKVAYDATADNPEKHAYLYALYVNNAAVMGSTLVEYHALDDKALEEYYALPSRADADEALKPYRDAMEAENAEIRERQDKAREKAHGLEVFKTIALGASPEEAKERVDNYEKQMAQAMGGQR